MTENTPFAPTTRKGEVRGQMWDDLKAAHDHGRIRATAVRASDFFGPGVDQSSYGERCFGRLAQGKPAELLGDPAAHHAVTFVPDFGEALVRAAERPASWGQAWLAPTAPAVPQQQLV
ncbi:NAD-dependent epimerase/dehydratase family protein, partial [Moorena sp. SIO3I6]|uniref:NAD-dependent epimerase/dehydratase family protein n=1 Tax=Moorena sp. SIO3I6 TaxID=2607831 RepID=UPI00344D81BB